MVRGYLEPDVEPCHEDPTGTAGPLALSGGVPRALLAKRLGARYGHPGVLDSAWELVLKAVVHTDLRWVLLYVERWLKRRATQDGSRSAGSRNPSGSAISPLLVNMFCITRLTRGWQGYPAQSSATAMT